MAVFSSLAAFFKRHRRKLLVASILTFSSYYAFDYFVIRKFRDLQDSFKREAMSKKQIQQRFAQTQEDCYYTILALLPVLTTPILDTLPVELITQALRLKKNTPKKETNRSNELTSDNLSLLDNNGNPSNIYLSKSKAELWNLLKIKTITRTLVLFYSISGLLLITRLQLNILGRRSYLESAISLAGVKQPPKSADDYEAHENYVIEQSYLSLSWWLLNKGWKNLHHIIEPIVVTKFEKVTPKTELSISEFQTLLLEIVSEISINYTSGGASSASNNIFYNLFPIQYDDLIETLVNTNPDLIPQLDNPESNFSKLVSETKLKILNSEEFDELFSSLVVTNINTLSTSLFDGLIGVNPLNSSSFLLDPENPTIPKIQELQEYDRSFKLANFLAQLSIQNGVIIDNDHIKGEPEDEDLEGFLSKINNQAGFLSGNDYINKSNEVQGLHEFSASIYSSYD